ncbi:MAG TPA: hypothetical protein VGP35_01225 [Terriglobales bacterium]|jgi:hypothetical protein|nr:hypothetical protein [Terriglobales bacterium]
MSRAAKWIVGIAGAIGVVLAALKSISDVAKALGGLNGWHVLFILSSLTLCGLGIDSYRQWLNSRFVTVQKATETAIAQQRYDVATLTQSLQKEREDRGAAIQDYSQKATKEIGKVGSALSEKIDAAIEKEQNNRAAAHSTAMQMISALDSRTNLEGKR